jgi:hypothetical protein
LGRTLLTSGRVDEALPMLEQAWVVAQGVPGNALLHGEAAFTLSRALWRTRTDRARARALAEIAAVSYESDAVSDAERRELAAWRRTIER